MINNWIATSSNWANAHMATISGAFAATLFFVYGDVFVQWVKTAVSGRPLVVRTAAFVALCAFGVPMMLAFVTPMIRACLLAFGPFWVFPTLVAAFIAVGVAAERRRLI